MTVLQEPAIAVMRAHASAEYPHECCGAIVGREEGETRVVKDAWPLSNASPEGQHRRFAISASDYRGVERRAVAEGLSLIGFYHSHPDGGAEPSAYDLARAWPNLDYFIISIINARPSRVTCWRLRDDRAAFDREEITWRHVS